MIINSVEDKYICSLNHERIMYQNIIPIDLLDHLWNKYDTVDDGYITANEKRMKKQWNPPTTIESLYQQLERGQKYAKKEEKTYPTANCIDGVTKISQKQDFLTEHVKNG